MTHDRRVFAVIPAAGHSRRMGRPKLLLPLAGQTVIARLVHALKSGGIDDVFVLAREADASLREELSRLPCITVTAAVDPEEMRHSVELLLQEIRQRCQPRDSDGWLLIPADHPFVEVDVLRRLTELECQHPEKVIIPTHDGQRGHPTLFPWSMATLVPEIPPGHGLNWLVRRESSRIVEVPCPEPSVLFDLDTPQDFVRATRLQGEIQ